MNNSYKEREAILATQPLTKEEQTFAAEHHDIVLKYLRIRRLDPSEYYDIVIFRYLRSVKRWFTNEKLRQYNFEIIAFMAMRSAIGNHKKKLKRQIKYGTTLSFDAETGENGTFLKDVIAAPGNVCEQIEKRETIQEQIKLLTPQQRKALYVTFTGKVYTKGVAI